MKKFNMSEGAVYDYRELRKNPKYQFKSRRLLRLEQRTGGSEAFIAQKTMAFSNVS